MGLSEEVAEEIVFEKKVVQNATDRIGKIQRNGNISTDFLIVLSKMFKNI